jgi:AraC-like DNA-binding protein
MERRVNTIAPGLGMSSRTLAQRLNAEGRTFGEILNQLRSDLAMLYLSEATFRSQPIVMTLLTFSGATLPSPQGRSA